MENLARSLKAQPLLADMNEAHLDFLSGCTKNQRVAEGQYLFREDQEAAQLYMVRRGKISLEVNTPTRGTIMLETLYEGDAMGWSALFAPYRWQADARVLKDGLVFAIDGTCLRKKMEADHDFGYAFSQQLLKEVHRRLERARLQNLDIYRTSD